MRTPEQVAKETIAREYDTEYDWRTTLIRAIADNDYADASSRPDLAQVADDMLDNMTKAIELDRAQRTENTITIEFDAEHRPEETIAEVLRQVEAGNTSGYYPNWQMHYDEPEES